MYVYRVVADSAYFMMYEEIINCAYKKSAKVANPDLLQKLQELSLQWIKISHAK